MMGILNVTPDSFFDGGDYLAVEDALARARCLVAEGAAVLDVGGQSTRPGYVEIEEAEEIARTAPVIRALAAEWPSVVISIDTYQVAVARAALAAGAHLLNDIKGLQGPSGSALARLAAEWGAGLVIMHHEPLLRELPPDSDPVPSVIGWLRKSMDLALAAGLPEERIVLDPGIGFGKTQAQNLQLLARLDELHVFGRPLLLGVSRKSVLGYMLTELSQPTERLEGTLALTAAAVARGVQLHRVHDVLANRRAAQVAARLRLGR
ncbi:MAG: dihydropteroate synthase [Verrucomicrobia bacterium]|nr:MAG: dihydropteroate synthase [Verrucomicrobiota bacterium]